MTAQQNGLRFDIYERVHLFEGVHGIKELEGVELVPHIQVLPLGEQALLRGNLLLSGTYVDEQDREGQTLEHLIPVEITLPMNRVNKVEDIAVEIENFDVDLLSARSLNVTGVLSLNGLEMVPSAENETWKDTEEEVVFVHEANVRASEPAGEPETSVPAAAFEEEQASAFAFAGVYGDVSPIREEPAAAATVTQWTAEEPEEEAVQVHVSAEIAPEIAEPQPAVSEPQEMKIAFGSKKAVEDAPAPIVKSYGLSSLLKNSGKPVPRDPEEADPAAAAAALAEKVEWKNILLSAREEQHQFKRLRMCIVQKEETLESIAKRYEINPREIALHNRLGDGEVSEGQVVYIPK